MEQKIHSDYQIIDINSITLDPENAKEHSEKDINEKIASLRMYGFTKPLVVSKVNNFIVAGNGMYLAAKAAGYKKIPVIYTDFSPVEGKAYGLTDNRLSDNSVYNLEQFNLNIKEISEWQPNFDWTALGFNSDEINLLLASMNTEITGDDTPLESSKEENNDIDEADAPAKPIKLTNGQRELFDEAVKRIRKSENDNKLSEGKIVEMLAANFLSGN